MNKLLTIICTFHLLNATLASRRHNNGHRNVAAFMDDRTSYTSCCFVDIFCYVGCFADGGRDNMRAFTADDMDGAQRPHGDGRRHRHRHHHGETPFRSKRSADDNLLWRKLRTSFLQRKKSSVTQFVT